MNLIRNTFVLGLFMAVGHFAFAGDSTSADKKINDFTTLNVKGNFNIVFIQGSCSLKITAVDQATMSAIDVKSTPTSLTITEKDGTTGGATLYIGLKNEKQISLNINGTVSNAKPIETGELALNIDGNATGTLTLDVKILSSNLSSGKELVLKGKVKQLWTFKDAGEGNIDASELKTENLNLDDSSDGDLKVYAKPEMHVKLEGSGAFTYYGNPSTKKFTLSGQATEKQITAGK